MEDILKRIAGLTGWLRENGRNCTEEQKHLDEGSQERIYYHYGYLMALKDVAKKQNN